MNTADLHDDEPDRVWERECTAAVETVLACDFERRGTAAIDEARRLLVVALHLAGLACPKCDGTGEDRRRRCPACEGSGEIAGRSS